MAAEANRIHGESAAVKNCLAPVEFVEYRQVDASNNPNLGSSDRGRVP